MAGAAVTAVVLALAGLAAWRVLRRAGKGDYCAMCSCGGCPRRGGGECHCHDGKKTTPR